MSSRKQRRLESTVAALQERYGPRAVRPAADLPATERPPAFSTAFAGLDAITGCGGLPLGHLTLLSGPGTSGKVTLAYKALANAQQPGATSRYTVALLDLGHSCDPDYLARCGLDLEYLLIIRPPIQPQTVDLLLDLVHSRQVRALLLDSLPDLLQNFATYRRFNASLARLNQLVRATGCALLLIDDPSPFWLRWFNLDRSSAIRQRVALHIEMQRERWLQQAEELVGYRAQARIRKSRWAHGQPVAPVEIYFNGTVRARATWG
jgi:hypothetical protein